jgi:predicted membrane protein (TIGR00267 family)
MSIKNSIKDFKKKFIEYDQIANFTDIGRRVFANNSFDGILTIIGILLGAYYSGINDAMTIVKTGLGASIAMGVSGAWGAYYTEKAERRKEIIELERAILKPMKNTKIEKAATFATIFITILDGLSPFLSSFIVIIPFFFIKNTNLIYAYISAICIAFLLLGLLGVFLGKISKENIYRVALRMMVAGVVCILLTLFLQVL